MITVAQDHRSQVAQICGDRSARTVGSVGVAEVPVFVHDHHPQPVAGVQQSVTGRIVRGAPGVASHRLQFHHAPGLQTVGNGDANSGKVLVVRGALNFHVPAV